MWERTMVGLDVHARSVLGGVLDCETGEVFSRSLAVSDAAIIDWLLDSHRSIPMAGSCSISPPQECETGNCPQVTEAEPKPQPLSGHVPVAAPAGDRRVGVHAGTSSSRPTPMRCSAHRCAIAHIVAVGFTALAVTNTLPSIT